jgi:hypothetical protein
MCVCFYVCYYIIANVLNVYFSVQAQAIAEIQTVLMSEAFMLDAAKLAKLSDVLNALELSHSVGSSFMGGKQVVLEGDPLQIIYKTNASAGSVALRGRAPDSAAFNAPRQPPPVCVGHAMMCSHVTTRVECSY